MTLRPVTVVTGASAGIGEALARVFASHGHTLVLIARRENRLSALADEIAAAGAPRPLVLPMDLARTDAATAIAQTLAGWGLEPEIVVNNAGFALFGAATDLDVASQARLIDVNVRALTELSLVFADALARRRGGILNVGSVAGFVPGPGAAAYYASKAYVLSFSEALHAELAPRGVRVTALCPGPVRSELQRRAGATHETYPPVVTISAERVAQAGYDALRAGRRVAVPGLANKLITLCAPRLPRAWLLALVARRQARRTRSIAG